MSVKYSAINDGLPTFNPNHPSLNVPNQTVALINEAVVAARRNPLSPAMLKAKNAEVSRAAKAPKKIPDLIYHLVFFKRGEDPIPFYVGITSKSRVGRREQEHLDGIIDPTTTKLAYVFAREKIEEGYDVKFEVLCDAADSTETEFLQVYAELGYPMQNEGTTVDVKRKKKEEPRPLTPKQEANKAFRELMKNPTKSRSSTA